MATNVGEEESRSTWRGGLVGGLILLGLYRLLVGPSGLAEWLAGILTAIVASASFVAVAKHQPAETLGRDAWAHLGRLPAKTVGDCLEVGLALLAKQAPAGEFHSVEFDPGGDDPRSFGRRALVIAGSSLPPNGYVVSLDRESERLLVHQLVVRAEPPGGEDREWPQ